MSSSSARTSTAQTQTTNTQNLNLQDTSGITLANSSGNTIVTTDLGAISAATDISRDALALGQSALDSGNQVAIASINSAADSAESSADRVARFATDSLESQSDLATQAINSVMDAGAGVLEFASGLFSDALSSQQKLTDQNIAGLTTLATQNSATSEDRIQKIVLYAIVAAAAIFILPKVIK